MSEDIVTPGNDGNGTLLCLYSPLIAARFSLEPQLTPEPLGLRLPSLPPPPHRHGAEPETTAVIAAPEQPSAPPTQERKTVKSLCCESTLPP